MTKLLMAVLCLTIIGCSETTNVDPIKDTGWVKIQYADYMYHKTLLFPDGIQREFFYCSPNEALSEEGTTVRIKYQGDGSTMQNCATNVEVQMEPGSLNAEGKKVWSGTTQIKGYTSLDEIIWLKPDGTKCGSAYVADSNWQASAYEDMTRTHYFSSKKEAVSWITDNWCKP